MSQQTASTTGPSYTTIPILTVGGQKSPKDLNGSGGGGGGTEKSVGKRVDPEEFAKLDALLEDLLAEVDQPIMLSKDRHAAANGNGVGRVSSQRAAPSPFNTSSYVKTSKILSSIDDIERSVDWLNEQKERLRSKREMLNKYAGASPQSPPLAMNDQQLRFADEAEETNNSYRKIKSKLDYYVTSSNGGILGARPAPAASSSSSSATRYGGFSYTNPADGLSKLNGASQLAAANNSDDTTTSSPSVTLNGTIDYSNNSGNEAGPYLNGGGVANKPPVSPNSRLLYSPVQNQNLGGSSFKSYNDVEDEMIAMANSMAANGESEMVVDRYGQRTYRPSTIQRTKYHLVSNDYIDCTKPAAPTPLPIQSNKIQPPSQNKRALSAPPTEVGKVFLQRMELKSPLTIRPSGSVVPFEGQPVNHYPTAQPQARFQLEPSEPVLVRNGVQALPVYNTNSLNRNPTSAGPNPYNNRGILKTGMQPARSVFLNRAYSETPRVAYTNGYETDTGVSYNGGYPGYRTVGPGYTTARSYVAEPIEASGPGSYHTIGSYRTQPAAYVPQGGGGGGPRYNYVSDTSGYDTDTGLIKLRQVLDNKRASSRQSNQAPPTPVQNGAYYYGTRSVTPSFNYNTYTPQGYPVDPRFVPETSGSPYMLDGYPMVPQSLPVPDGFVETNEFMQPAAEQSLNGFQYNGAGSYVDQSLPGYITPTGRQLVAMHPSEMPLQEMANGSYRSTTLQPQQSFIVHQQVAPSAYLKSASQSAFQGPTGTMNTRDLSTPNRLAGGSSTNLVSQPASTALGNKEDPKRGSQSSLNGDSEVLRNHPKSVKATQNFWYKPKISREEAINLLKDKSAGTFLIRDSNNFPGAYGLALKVDKPPANVQIKPGADPTNELVRHFLIEPTTKGVRIKGCCNEPVFGSLAALVYQHSITPLALPAKLILPTQDLNVNEQPTNNGSSTQPAQNKKQNTAPASQEAVNGRQLLDKGAACNVYYLNTVTLENTNIGLEAITKALGDTKAFTSKDSSQLILIQFKVTGQGITLTDIQKKKFLRQHFPTSSVIYCAIEEKITWPVKLEKIAQPRIFGVICKPRAGVASYECHLFVELDPEQPAIAIVDFINRYLIPSKQQSSSKDN